MSTLSSQSPRPPRFIARQVALGFGSVSLVAGLMCIILLTIIYEVSGMIASMRESEEAIRQGRELTASVRELSLHIAHAVIDSDATHLEQYEQGRSEVAGQVTALGALAPEGVRWRLDELTGVTNRMHELLYAVALPVAKRHDVSASRGVQRELKQLGEQAAVHADALAIATSSQMAHSHVLATQATKLGIVFGGACVLLVLVLSAGFTWRLQRAVLQPLVALTRAAERFGQGQFESRVGNVGRGELAALGNAMDHMADELAERETRLVQTERMAALGQLAAGVAHELNNPIGIIRGYLKTMSPDEEAETLAEELAILDEEAAQCQRIAEDLLSYARTGELHVRATKMGELVGDVVQRFADTPEGQGRSVVVQAAAESVELDPTRFRQLLFNLLSNACQASPRETEISVVGKREGEYYVLEVADTGIGIESSDLERIFEPFYSRRQGGSGLGLSVCLGIVRAHHGTISAEAREAGRTVLRVELPLTQPPRGSGGVVGPPGDPAVGALELDNA